jgi:hypothetical protein
VLRALPAAVTVERALVTGAIAAIAAFLVGRPHRVRLRRLRGRAGRLGVMAIPFVDARSATRSRTV